MADFLPIFLYEIEVPMVCEPLFSFRNTKASRTDDGSIKLLLYVGPTFTRLHVATFQKASVFIPVAVRT